MNHTPPDIDRNRHAEAIHEKAAPTIDANTDTSILLQRRYAKINESTLYIITTALLGVNLPNMKVRKYMGTVGVGGKLT